MKHNWKPPCCGWLGDLLERGGNFDEFIRSRELVKQEGILFEHLLRMILIMVTIDR